MGSTHVHFKIESAHRITATHGKVTTLVIVGRKQRVWGFYNQDGGFIDWRAYHANTNGWNDQQRTERELHAQEASRG